MIYFDCADKDLDARVKQVCAPLFATVQFLRDGHHESTTSATVTFIRFEGRIYGVTCHHVLAAFYAAAIKQQKRIIPTLHTTPGINQIGWPTAFGGYQWGFQSCREFLKPTDLTDSEAGTLLDRKNADKPDIGIADLTDMWPLLQQFRAANAIDLDAWIEPDWSTAQSVWMAFGYPDDHKYRQDDKISAPMPRVSAQLVSAPSTDRTQFTLCSTLASAHGWGFSGLSGGPIVAAHTTEDRYAFVGITFEGSPSTKEALQSDESFVGKEDILLFGYYLSPDRFREWLTARSHSIEFPAQGTAMPVSS